MAKVSYISPVSEVRGTIGGAVYSANGASPYIKSRRMPVRKLSEPQNFGRVLLASLPGAWRDITDQQRADWATWAALPAQARTNSLGVTYYLSGYQQYCACNLRLAWFLITPISDAPTAAKPDPPTTCTLDIYQASTGGSTLVIDEDEYDDAMLILDLAFFVSPTALGSSHQYKTVLREVYPVSSPLQLQTPAEDAWGDLIVDQLCLARLYRIGDDGQASTSLDASTIVQA
jgi:hypothetical protein